MLLLYYNVSLMLDYETRGVLAITYHQVCLLYQSMYLQNYQLLAIHPISTFQFLFVL